MVCQAAMLFAVVAGGNSARVVDLTGAEINNVQAEAVDLASWQTVFSVAWSPDGQLLTVSTTVSAHHSVCAVMFQSPFRTSAS